MFFVVLFFNSVLSSDKGVNCPSHVNANIFTNNFSSCSLCCKIKEEQKLEGNVISVLEFIDWKAERD